MQFKNKWKRFWTLSRRHEEGFTLVELIVVIAILAILAGVGTVGYSAYVNKANMVADQTRVAEIVNALQLAYYSEGKCEAGAIVLTTEQAEYINSDPSLSNAGVASDTITVSDDFIDRTLSNAFGSNWRETLKLSYSKWSDEAKIANHVFNTLSQDEAKYVANSSYLTNKSSSDLLNAVTTMTNAASGVLTNYATNGGNTTTALNGMLGDDFTTNLNKVVSESDSNYATAASNMMVLSIAKELDAYYNGETAQLSTAAGLAMTYASVYAYSTTVEGGDEQMASLNAALAGASSAADLNINGWLANTADPNFSQGYTAYTNDSADDSAFNVDTVTFMNIMGAVNAVNDDGSYANKEDLTNAGLFTSAKVTDHLDGYISTVKMYANMSPDEAAMLEKGKEGVTIIIDALGNISVTPASAMPD